MRVGHLTWVAWIRSSIAAQIVVGTAAVTFVMFAAHSVRSYRTGSEAIERSVTRDMDRTGMATAHEIGNWFEGRNLLVEMANESAATVPEGTSVVPLFDRKVLTSNFLVTYFGAARNGRFDSYPASENMPADYDPRKRPWYRAAVAIGKPVLTEPYIDASTNEDVVTIASPLYRNGKLEGVTGADFTLRALVQMLRKIDLDGNGYAFLVSKDGTILVHPNHDYVGKKLSAIFGPDARVQPRVSSVSEGGVNQLLDFSRIPGLPSVDWYVGIAMDKAKIYADLEHSRWTSAIITALITIFALVVTWIVLSRVLLGPLGRITAAMSEIAKGQFETDIPFAGRRDELGAMARAVAVFRDNGIQIIQLTQAEAGRLERDTKARAAMMADLQKSFGKVVNQAVAGNFTSRVEDHFADAELRALASSVNMLVETIDRGLGETGQVLSALAQTDLSQRIEGDYQGAFAKLKSDTNAVADNLSHVIAQIRTTSRQVKGATTDLLRGAVDLSDRTDKQALAIQETAAAVQQLTLAVTENANYAETASTKAVEATHAADQAGTAMAEATGAMDRMTTASGMISSIIGMIDNIASQTSLVALNASIEAARAGDAGAGFAVVAIEVRSLAQRAAQASSDVTALIEQSASEIHNGSGMVAQAAGKLTNTLSAVRDNSELLNAIATASREQAASIDAISVAISQVDQFTRHNSALANELNTATTQTKAQASKLDQIVDIFTLETDTPGKPRTRTA
ncbi:methyl-accepting chemotaxis protein McpU [soil metagenome]